MTLEPDDACLNRISQEFSFEDIAEATDHFSAPSRLGVGTYGSVHRGTLKDGSEVAVKALSKPNEAGFREEVEVLSRFRHPNLVILMGFARHHEERYLVYELLPGGDVCSRLQEDPSFTWRSRLSVALDAALGLSHLHGSRPQVFHRDIKTQNILMDRNGTGKMADFGLALLAQPNCGSLTVENASGTIGYADPLYIRTGTVTEGSEVYSFGMVLLEVLTGRPPALQHLDGRIEYQFTHIRGEVSRVLDTLDPQGQWPQMAATILGLLALRCIHHLEAVRPAFAKIVTELRSMFHDVAPGRSMVSLPQHPAPVGAASGACGMQDLDQTIRVPGSIAAQHGCPASHLPATGRRPGFTAGMAALGSSTRPLSSSTRPLSTGQEPRSFLLTASSRPTGLVKSSTSHPSQASLERSIPASAATECGRAVAASALAGDGSGRAVADAQPVMVDCSPVACVDCGPPEADIWIDPRPCPGVTLEPRPNVPSSAAGNFPPTGYLSVPAKSTARLPDSARWSPSQVVARPATSEMARPAKHEASEEQKAAMKHLSDELGFSTEQIKEAFKRCSTAEGAIDWILSPEREWNQ
mmetsp:Transcript_18417/g.36119  ORF Transcript_18417/g.36119 Transcript_18417/m.36119 type:complete len:582 (+) Transcript_18417:75-1820(+)|eukprot:CAMPEP_0172816018 /NCGR_PEP_ID=MMETSP1075-20121228/12155_1 /TAXON_ID=2916 /ORGANISM="Ceratium fusus, Strain PA161109" /LENGTH=581 /DNA_ID=CAMNT_0013655935 /DNA_START=72 /DNA_END=1817 /DNA_ORIENTATION=-